MSTLSPAPFRPAIGQIVRVRSALEIAASLADDGCQMACAFFWKTAWLSSDLEHAWTDAIDETTREKSDALGLSIRSESTRGVYRCQATQLSVVAARSNRFDLSRLVDEHNLNELPVTSMVSDMCSTLLARVRRQRAGLVGPCTRTPIVNLNLILSSELVKEAVKINIATAKAIAIVVSSQCSDFNHRTVLASRPLSALGSRCDPE